MRVYKTKEFGRFAHKERITDTRLCEAAVRAGRGLIDADLGGGRVERRVARQSDAASGKREAGGEAILQLLFQHQREEAAGDVTADCLVELVIDRPRFEQTFGCAECPLSVAAIAIELAAITSLSAL